MTLDPRDRLIVALDSAERRRGAKRWSSGSATPCGFYKIGYQLAFVGGLALAQTLTRAGKQVFLDLKLHDIGNTVAQGRGERRRAWARAFSPCMPIRRPCMRRSTPARAQPAHSRGHRADLL